MPSRVLKFYLRSIFRLLCLTVNVYIVVLLQLNKTVFILSSAKDTAGNIHCHACGRCVCVCVCVCEGGGGGGSNSTQIVQIVSTDNSPKWK